MRLFWAVLGAALVALGLIVLALVAIAVTVQGAHLFVLGFIPALLVMGIGLLLLFKVPYRVVPAGDGLSLSFIFGNVKIPWCDVMALRKLLVRMSFRSEEGMLYTIVTYVTQERNHSWAFLVLRGYGAGASLSPREYETELDKYLSTRGDCSSRSPQA